MAARTMSRTFFLTSEEYRWEARHQAMRANRKGWAGTLDTVNGRVAYNSAASFKGLYR